MEQSDGIKYMVTLDAQYQMQPTLGNFVSQNFCEPYSESFRSPRPAEDFPQAICPLSVQYREAEQHGAICRLVTAHGMLFINVFVNGKRPGFLCSGVIFIFFRQKIIDKHPYRCENSYKYFTEENYVATKRFYLYPYESFFS